MIASGTTPPTSGSATTISWCGDTSLRVFFGVVQAGEALARVALLHRRLRLQPPEGFLDATPAYATLLIRLDPRVDWKKTDSAIRELVESMSDSKTDSLDTSADRVVEIPVCYESAFAPDLETLASEIGLGISDVIAMHSAAEYNVAFVGFTPGFPYLLGLPEKLHSARLARPRVRVPAGSVGIAGGQTGIYPRETPGGWKLIGRTPLRMFDAGKPTPSLLLPGNRVKFVPIDAERFDALSRTECAR